MTRGMVGWGLVPLVLSLQVSVGCGSASTSGQDLGIAAEDLSAGAADLGGDLSMPADLDQPDLVGIPDLAQPDLIPPPDLTMPCPVRPMGEWHVSPLGSDTLSTYSGNGSAACPFKTVSHAISLAMADGFTATIRLHHIGSGSPAVYGKNCTGGPPCDVDFSIPQPIQPQLITIEGDGAVGDVVLTSDSPTMIHGRAPGLVLKNFTIKPLYQGAPSDTSGYAVIIEGANSTLSGITLEGIKPTSTGSGTFIGISVQGSGITIGPGVTITNGQRGIYGGSTLLGSATAPTLIQDMTVQGAAVESVKTLTPGTKTVTVARCGGNGVTAGAVDGLTVTNTGLSATTLGLSGSDITNTLVTDLVGTGLNCNNCKVNGGVVVQKVVGTGVVLGTSSGGGVKSTIVGLTSTMNMGDGLRCFASSVLDISDSVLSGNSGNGLLAYNTCYLTMNNVEFNRTSKKNGLSGLCLLETNPDPISATGYTFGCGYTGSGCVMSGTASFVTAATCQAGVDITVASASLFSAPSPTCCN